MTKKKIWKDLKGNEIPAKYVPKLDKDRETVAVKHYATADKLSKMLEKFKDEVLADCDAIYEKMMAENNVPANSKGGYSISTFDREIKIEVSIQERIEFDDLITAAHEKIKLFLEEKTKGVDTELAALVNQAFETRKGRMDTKRVLGLFRLQITHPLWIEAMELIKRSISRNDSKRYVQIMRKDPNGEYKMVNLNFAAF